MEMTCVEGGKTLTTELNEVLGLDIEYFMVPHGSSCIHTLIP